MVIKSSLFIVMFILMLFLVSCSNSVLDSVSADDVPVEKVCTIDSDCLPKECCHAKGAINKDSAPDCAMAICTMNCEPETLDCGQGEVKCVEGSCEAIIFN
ncbi:MAG: hypothetical protein ABIH82_01490 [Candidatus Woesearchaeota archaeon]